MLSDEELHRLKGAWLTPMPNDGESTKLIRRLISEYMAIAAERDRLLAERCLVPCAERMPRAPGWYAVVTDDGSRLAMNIAAGETCAGPFPLPPMITHWFQLPPVEEQGNGD